MLGPSLYRTKASNMEKYLSHHAYRNAKYEIIKHLYSLRFRKQIGEGGWNPNFQIETSSRKWKWQHKVLLGFMDSGGQSGWMGWMDTALYVTLIIRCKYTIHMHKIRTQKTRVVQDRSRKQNSRQEEDEQKDGIPNGDNLRPDFSLCTTTTPRHTDLNPEGST